MSCFGSKKLNRFPIGTMLLERLSGFVVWWCVQHMHTNVYAVYACGCPLSVTCQVAMVNATTELLGSSDLLSKLTLSKLVTD